MDFKCKKPLLVTVVLKLIEIFLKPQLLTAVLKEVSLKPQLQTVVLQFPLKPQFLNHS